MTREAPMPPTEPLPDAENYCDECRLCMASCASGLMNGDQTTHVSMGGKTFSYSKRRSYLRCEFVCDGFTGLHPGGNCQLICHPHKAVRQERYDMLRKSGVVIQKQDGSLTAVSAQEAAAHFTAMDASTRLLYMDVHDT